MSATGGIVGTGGAGTGGAAGTGDWAEWPMPNDQVDVTGGAPNLESYTDNGDGTVTDNVTGLMWQQAVPATTYSWAQAVAYCPTLTLAGHSDWRLPSRIELVSIADPGHSPSINSTYFPSTPTKLYWSSSEFVGSSSEAWIASFTDGSSGQEVVFSTYNVRCVRTSANPSAPTGRYVMTSGDGGTGTVYDTKTKLTWQQTVPSGTYAWGDAKTYCAGLNLVGVGWRIPTVKELQTIVDDSRTNPATDPNAFPSTPSSWFWSSSAYAFSSGGWLVDFYYGAAHLDQAYYTHVVRCVR
jgi:hypothetical protein